MHYAPTTPAFDWTDMVCGTILFLVATATTIKIFKGSKSAFAFWLMVFAIGYTLTDFV